MYKATILLSACAVAVVNAANECAVESEGNIVASPQGTVCREAVSDCDVQEVCDGSSLDCPEDSFKPQGEVVHAATTVCDVAVVCSGADAVVPEHVYRPSTTVARAAVSDCDVAEYCSGTDDVVPPDAFKPAGTVVRAAASFCDVAEVCTGVSATVPPDAFKPSSTVARLETSVCDVTEYCTGTDGNMPEDKFQPATKVVHPKTSNDNCDPAEYCSGTSADVPDNVDNCVIVGIDVLGQSGKFRVFDSTLGSEDPNAVTVELDYLYEVDASGATVPSNGSVKHSLQSFANQRFTIENPVDTVVPSTSVSAQKVSFSSPVSTVGKIKVDTYILKSSGTIGTDNESWDVRKNDVKFNIVLSDWSFCAPCGNGKQAANGEFIDVSVKIKGKGASPEKKEGSDMEYDLGGDVPLTLSSRVLVDGAWTDMPEGFPKFETQGSSASFIFRFPKFTTSAVYDPVLGLSANIQDPISTSDNTNNADADADADSDADSDGFGEASGAYDATFPQWWSAIIGVAGVLFAAVF